MRFPRVVVLCIGIYLLVETVLVTFLAIYANDNISLSTLITVYLLNGFNTLVVIVALVYSDRECIRAVTELQYVDPSLEESYSRAISSGRSTLYESIAAVIFVILSWELAAIIGLPLPFGPGWQGWLVMYPLSFVSIAMFACLIDLAVRQGALFKLSAKRVKIDLLNLDVYAAYSGPAVRMTLVLLALSCPFVSLAVLFEEFEKLITVMVFLVLASWTIFYLVCLPPLLVIKSRISEEKNMEIQRVMTAFNGAADTLSESRLAHRVDEFSGADLLAYLNYLRDLPEWPIQGQIQKVVLFGLLPPLAWIMAALMERLVDLVVT